MKCCVGSGSLSFRQKNNRSAKDEFKIAVEVKSFLKDSAVSEFHI